MSENRSFAIVPAAGRSVRMGQAKLSLPWGQSTVIEEVLGRWQRSGVDQIVVVVHPEDVQLASLCRSAKATVLTPAAAPPDMKASVSIALEHIRQHDSPAARDAWLLAPADMPWIEPELIGRLIEHYRRTRSSIIAPAYQGKRGHPVLFSWPLAAKVGHLPAGEGIRSLIRDHPADEIDWPRDTILGDLDTPQDYRQWYERYHH